MIALTAGALDDLAEIQLCQTFSTYFVPDTFFYHRGCQRS